MSPKLGLPSTAHKDVSADNLPCIPTIPIPAIMSNRLILPVPCSSSLISLGQLLTDPLDPVSTSFRASTERADKECTVQTRYHDTVSQDDEGRLIPSGPSWLLNDLEISAEQSSYHSLVSPNTAFKHLRNDTATQSFLRQTASLNKPLYFVTSIQKLSNPTFKSAAMTQEPVTEATCADRQFCLPLPVRRDSATHDLQNPSKQQVIFAIGITKVKCRVGAANEPHSLDDLDYNWSYHPVDDPDMQLSIGLGKAVTAAEWRKLTGIVGEEEEEEEEKDKGYYTYFSDDDEGFAGF